MRRSRLTWKVAESEMPKDESNHPADQGQQASDKYLIESGEPSDFAEDVHKGPYPNGAAPSVPSEQSDHPASMKQAAMEIRASVERKASKCIRIAQATLGRTATIAQIEDQALAFMDMSDTEVDATLSRLADLNTSVEEPVAKEAHYADEDAELEAFMAEFMADEEEAMFDAADDEAEEMLAEMLRAEEWAEDGSEEEAMLAEMEAMEAMHHEDHEADEEMEEIVMDDPMGLMGDDSEMMEDDLLAGLFADRMAGKKSEDEKEEKEEKEEGKEKEEAAAESIQEEAEEEAKEEDEEKEASKKASRLRPRARKASKGVKSVGQISKAAKSEVTDLSNLWASAPDISNLF